MRINNNLMAMNTHRQLSVNNTAGAKSIEKLSSGYRINRAGDDAAGLAISEKMRGQIRGLSQASKNAQDDISLIQTTEGALNETHAIIQRMREMAVQSANDTNTDDDRQALQNEMNQLAQEVTRISNTTEFNTRKLLNGNLDKNTEHATGDLTFHIGANTGQNMKFAVKAMDAKSLGLAEDVAQAPAVHGKAVEKVGAETFTATDQTGKLNGWTLKFTDGGAGPDPKVTVSKDSLTISVAIKTEGAGGAAGMNELNVAAVGAIQNAIQAKQTDLAALKEFKFESATTATKAVDLIKHSFHIEGGKAAVDEKKSTVATFQADGKVADAVVAKGIDISTQAAANKAITRIDSALKRVSDQRAELGAVQNRLGHTIKNVDTAAENLQASESRIRDVDMAKEMMEFTKNNILQQASQAMLAQANQAPQGVLQLLR